MKYELNDILGILCWGIIDGLGVWKAIRVRWDHFLDFVGWIGMTLQLDFGMIRGVPKVIYHLYFLRHSS